MFTFLRRLKYRQRKQVFVLFLNEKLHSKQYMAPALKTVMLAALKLPKLRTTTVVTSIFALLLFFILSWSAETTVASPQVGKLFEEQH